MSKNEAAPTGLAALKEVVKVAPGKIPDFASLGGTALSDDALKAEAERAVQLAESARVAAKKRDELELEKRKITSIHGWEVNSTFQARVAEIDKALAAIDAAGDRNFQGVVNFDYVFGKLQHIGNGGTVEELSALIREHLTVDGVYPKVVGGKLEVPRFRYATESEVRQFPNRKPAELHDVGAFRIGREWIVRNSDPTNPGRVMPGQEKIEKCLGWVIFQLAKEIRKAQKSHYQELLVHPGSTDLVSIHAGREGTFKLLFKEVKDGKTREGILIVEHADRNKDKADSKSFFAFKIVDGAGCLGFVEPLKGLFIARGDCVHGKVHEKFCERLPERFAKVPDVEKLVHRLVWHTNQVLWPSFRAWKDQEKENASHPAATPEEAPVTPSPSAAPEASVSGTSKGARGKKRSEAKAQANA